MEVAHRPLAVISSSKSKNPGFGIAPSFGLSDGAHAAFALLNANRAFPMREEVVLSDGIGLWLLPGGAAGAPSDAS